MAQNPRADRSRSSLRSHCESRNPPRANAKYSSMKMPPDHDIGDSSHHPPSPSMRQAQPNFKPRPSQTFQRKGSSASDRSARPPTPVSKASMDGSHSSTQHGPQSSLLQHKLQQERRSEIERSLTRLADEMDADTDAKPSAATPIRWTTSDSSKQQDSGPESADVMKKGLALKETEQVSISRSQSSSSYLSSCTNKDQQTMSTLHKQNFDLKLELFHRRERQTVLEEQVELLEAGKAQVEETNATLLQELEKRDKAVSEAVHMIISLETRIDLLLREREMIRQLESDKAFLSHLAQSPSTTLVGHTDTAKDSLGSPPTSDRNKPFYTPSFMSGQTESVEAVRDAHSRSEASYLTLPKTDSRADNNRGFASPSVSILSESSFVSVYGQRDTRDSSVPPDIPINASRKNKNEGHERRSTSSSTRDFTPLRSHGLESLGSRDGARDAPEDGDASLPLRKLELLEKAQSNYDSNNNTISATSAADRSQMVRPVKPQPLMRLKPRKERPRRKIIADETTTSNHTLPPTPDTATSSVLNHGQEFNMSPGGSSPSPYGFLVPRQFPGERLDKTATNQWRLQDSALSPQAPSFTAFTGRQECSGSAFPELQSPRLRRPQSADETTISRHRNDWESGSELDDGVSEASSFDYWMKEGLQPSQGRAAGPTSFVAANRDSPDFLGFPSDDNGWRSNNLSAALSGTGYPGANGPLAPALDAMGASLPSPEVGLYGSGLAGSNSPRPAGSQVAPPPAPYRKSSLNARTSAPGTPTTTRFLSKAQNIDRTKQRSISGHAPGALKSSERTTPTSRSQTPTLPARTQHQQPEHPAQKRHYPPQASQQYQQTVARPRSRGITSLFRRSWGAGPTFPTSASVPAAQSPFAPPVKRDHPAFQVGIPAWERRDDLTDNVSSTTPPPIIRKKAASKHPENGNGVQLRGITPSSVDVSTRGSSLDVPEPGLGVGLNRVITSEDGGASLMHNMTQKQAQDTSVSPVSHGHGRKWFGLGRVTSLKYAAS